MSGNVSRNGIHERAIFAGSGGQGVMTLGKILAHAMMLAGKHVTYFPCYGTEVRGGTANCHVIVSEEEIFSPVVETATALIIMNQPSCDRFLPQLAEDGLLVLNTSLAEAKNLPSEATVVSVNATDTAAQLGSLVVGNMIMLGAYIGARAKIDPERVFASVKKLLGVRHADVLELNRKAYEVGMEIGAKALR